MRLKSSWSDCFPLQIYWTWIVAGVVAAGLLLLSECTPREAHAGQGWQVELGAGLSIFQKTAQDGLWHQRPLPNTWELNDPAFKVGLAYQWERWGLHAAYVSLGSIKVKAGFVGDEHYDPKNHICLATCEKLSWLEASDSVKAYELAGSYRWNPDGISPFVKLGAALMTHRFTVINGKDFQQLYGRLPAVTYGAGLCYQWACAESTYYHTVSGLNLFGWPAYPLFENVFVTMLTVRIPLS